MKLARRKFIRSAALTGGAAAIIPLYSACSNKSRSDAFPDYSAFDEALNQPVLQTDLFPDPVIIDNIEFLRDRSNFICRVRTKDGAEGIAMGHPFIAKQSYPMFMNSLYGKFINKDARDLENLLYRAVEDNIKLQGIPMNVHIANIEFAILDMLGNIAGKPVGELFGKIYNPEISIYLGTRLEELRRREPEESLELVALDWAATKAKAIKIRAGKGDNLGLDNENAPGRTEKLVRMAREKFGDEMVLMIDGNGTYSLEGAIRLGKLIEEYKYYFYEEPVPWDWYEEQKRVADALQVKMAGGEEEFGVHSFRWLIANNAFDIFQPDIFYYGGMTRSLKVARMARAGGKTISPHLSAGGLGWLYMLHFTSACPNPDKYHEFKMFDTVDANGTTFTIEPKTGKFESIDGVIKVPTGPGLGIVIDPGYLKTHKPVNIQAS